MSHQRINSSSKKVHDYYLQVSEGGQDKLENKLDTLELTWSLMDLEIFNQGSQIYQYYVKNVSNLQMLQIGSGDHVLDFQTTNTTSDLENIRPTHDRRLRCFQTVYRFIRRYWCFHGMHLLVWWYQIFSGRLALLAEYLD